MKARALIGSDIVKPFNHPATTSESVGILLVNSGTPDSLATKDVRRFLAGLLGDPRVVELPRWLWLPILHGIILRTRPYRSARKYRKIWTERGSPLAYHSRELTEKLRQRFNAGEGNVVAIESAMLYSTPGVDLAMQRLLAAGARKILILPLFPQYSSVSTGAVFDHVAKNLSRQRWLPALRFVESYHDHPSYIEALRQSVLSHWAVHGRTRHLLFAYHGIPQKYFDRGDPYYCLCHKTSRLLAQALHVPESDWTLSFQSRFGPGRWLQPYTDDTLRSLPKRDVREVTVVSPGFAADCLETLEELGIEGRDQFLQAGGLRYEYVPALNSTDAHVDMLATIAMDHLTGWLTATRPINSDNKGLVKRRFAERI